MRRKDIESGKVFGTPKYSNMVEIQANYIARNDEKEILPSYADNCQSTKYPTGISQSEK